MILALARSNGQVAAVTLCQVIVLILFFSYIVENGNRL